MIRLTLAQMRQSLPRLTAAGVAILIGTAFVTVTLLAGTVMTQTTNASLSAQFGDADLVAFGDGLTAEDTATVRQVDGVAAADPTSGMFVELSHGRSRLYQYAIGTPSDARLASLSLDAGGFPQSPGQITLPVDLADRFGVAPGGQIEATWTSFDGDEPVEHVEALTVVGIVTDPHNAYGTYGGAAVLDAGQLAEWDAAQRAPGRAFVDGIAIVLADGADRDAVRAELIESLAATPEVLTPDEYAAARNRALTGGQDVFVGALLSFAAIALVVAALVIANTFQVLVAHRTRTLALLRAVGATRRQLSRAVLLEGAIIGGSASLLGFGLGCALGQIALAVASRLDLGAPLPTTITVTPVTALVPVLVGIAVTLLACTAPARSTRRVSPLEALRPTELRDGRRAGRVRLAAFLAVSLVGFALLAAGIGLGRSGSAEAGIGVAVLGGALSFVGLVLGGVFWLPAVVALAGRAVSRTGPAGRLAAANTLRNPRRTTATSAALLIGVTLVATMSTGALSARASTTAALGEHYPIDLEVATAADRGGDPIELPADVLDRITALRGVTAVAPSRATDVRIDGTPLDTQAIGVDPATLAAVTRDPDATAGLADDTVLLSGFTAADLDLEDGSTVTVAGPGGASADLRVQVRQQLTADVVVTAATLERIAPSTPVTGALVRIDDDAVASAVADVQDIATSATTAVSVMGPATDRAYFDRLIDIVLAVVVGLLAVAVVIALIGVTNTLSLSVLERRRESATLRAIGLTRRQLRRTLAVEGLLIAGVGALSGIVLGVGYGWAGALAAFSLMGDVTLAVPWRDLAVLMAVALAAGWLASVLPARAATRTPPVASLAQE